MDSGIRAKIMVWIHAMAFIVGGVLWTIDVESFPQALLGLVAAFFFIRWFGSHCKGCASATLLTPGGGAARIAAHPQGFLTTPSWLFHLARWRPLSLPRQCHLRSGMPCGGSHLLVEHVILFGSE